MTYATLTCIHDTLKLRLDHLQKDVVGLRKTYQGTGFDTSSPEYDDYREAFSQMEDVRKALEDFEDHSFG